ncbi:MAG TPA: DUF2339 domain-containing protein [Bacteroidetes bacterium]|nr:DUF2339 domain-containing protein [Bacteroidota bacterium]
MGGGRGEGRTRRALRRARARRGAGALGCPMTDDSDLRARIEALEARVAELEAQRAPSARPAGGPRRRERPARPPGLRVRWAEARSEDVLGKVGIALFLVGVLFLLKEAVDRGWLTAAVRVGGAGAIGAALIVLGERLRDGRPVLGRLLTGGGIAALFGTLWTAGVLYPLLPPLVAFAGMAGVAALALLLASREADAALSVVGTLGALMTPLLLYREGGHMALLMGYTVLVLAGAAVVYWRQGWAALAGAMAAGGWGVVLVAWIVGLWPQVADGLAEGLRASILPGDRWAFTLGALATALTTAGVPLLRAMTREAPAEPFWETWPSLLRPEALAAAAGPLLLLFFLDIAWSFSDAAFVGLAVVAALGLGLAKAGRLTGALRISAAVFAAWAAGRLLGPDDARTAAVVVALGCGLVALGRRDRQRDVALVGHAVALGAAAVLALFLAFAPGFPFGRLEPVTGVQLLNATLAAALGAVALGAVGFTSGRETAARAFHLTAAHVVVVLWLRVLLGGVDNGTALTSGAWGVYGIALVVVGLRLGDDLVRGIGLGTVLVTVAKVLLVDLSQVPALSRILLFMGLGALLLVVSYFVPSLLKGRPSDASAGDGRDGGPGGDGLAPPPIPQVPERDAAD